MSDGDLEGVFREPVRAARLASGMRQEDIAALLRISQQSVAKLEGEGQRKRVGLNEAADYARALGVPLEDLLGLAVPAVDKEALAQQYEQVGQCLAEEHQKYAEALKAVDELEKQFAHLEQQLAEAKRVCHRIETQISLQGVRKWQLGELLDRSGSSGPTPARQFSQNWQPLSEDEDRGEHQEA